MGYMFHLANTIPWDGATGGRMDAIFKYTEAKEKGWVRDFLKGVSPLHTVVSECLNPPVPHSLLIIN